MSPHTNVVLPVECVPTFVRARVLIKAIVIAQQVKLAAITNGLTAFVIDAAFSLTGPLVGPCQTLTQIVACIGIRRRQPAVHKT